MLRHLSVRVLNDTKDVTRISNALVNLFLCQTRQCHRRDIFHDEVSGYSAPQNYDSKQSRSKFPYRQSSFNESREHSFRRNPRSNYGDHHSPRERNFYNGNEAFQRTDRYPSSFGSNELGYNLKKASYDDVQPVQKNFYAEHPDVSERSEDEVNTMRQQWNMKVRGSDVPKPIKHFEELCLPESLKQLVLEQDYTEPTPIQAQGWPTALSGRDMVGISQTGSGKTLVFALPAIVHALNQNEMYSSRQECKPQILVLAPTRELVQQILEVSNRFSHSVSLSSAAAYGGASKNVQLSNLRGANICVATPGRLIDFVASGLVSLRNCTYLVLDEADRMLDMGFEPQIRKIVDQIRPDRQTLMWSATWPKEIRELAEDFLDNYVSVTVGAGQLAANPNIEQNVYILEEADKMERIVELLRAISEEEKNKVLVFAQTKRTVDDLSQYLNRKGIHALAIHGDVSQSRRDQVLYTFRRKKSCVLIATDVAARGLDITDVQHVVNYDLPTNIEDYIHRIGRTARGFSTGVSHSFFTLENAGLAKDLVGVLKQANQPVSNELLDMITDGHKQKSRGRYGFQKGHNYQQRRYALQ